MYPYKVMVVLVTIIIKMFSWIIWTLRKRVEPKRPPEAVLENGAILQGGAEPRVELSYVP